MTNEKRDSTEHSGRWRHKHPGRMMPPGRIWGDDSIDASSEGPDRTDDGFSFSAGYECSMTTRIGDEDSDNPQVEHLRKLHEGRHPTDGEHSLRESQRDKKRIAQALCSALPLAKHEREQVVAVVEDLNLDRFGNQKGIPRVTLGVVAVVVDERNRTAGNDQGELVRWTDKFRSLCEKHEVSMSDLSTIKEIVREVLGSRPLPVGDYPVKRDPALPGPTAPTDYPDEYWEDRSAEYWVGIARMWDRHGQEFQEAIPDDHRRIVDALRRWEPWKEEVAGEDERSPAEAGSVSEDDEVELEDVEAEAESIVELIEADLDDDTDE